MKKAKGLKQVNLFKLSYKTVRDNSDEIYKGFGFRHLSDATQYYVHPDNQSYDGTTTLCQPIGESVILFASMMSEIIKGGNDPGDYFFREDSDEYYIKMNIPQDYRDNGVTSSFISYYLARFEPGNKITVGAYGNDGKLIADDAEGITSLYKMLPSFGLLLARENETNDDFRALMDSFVENPAVDGFVNLHEDFYQAHKLEQFDVDYDDIVIPEELKAFSESCKVVIENKKEIARESKAEIVKFDDAVFTEEQKTFIPDLPEEFVLQEKLCSVCSAVTNGDALAVLFHGPSGTGKTISCKLVAQSIGLPIMETINCTENLDEFVLGKYIPQDDRIIFKESYVTKAIREGGAVVFEEINFARPQYLAFLNSLLDDNGFVRLDNGEVVKRHKNFRFFATMNLGYFGTKELNQALYNRFNVIYEIAALSDEAITKMLLARIPECEPVVNKLLGVYHKLKKKIESEELDIVISPRNLENWARLARYEGYITAAEKTIIPIAKCDRVFENMIRGILMLYKWN